jgi:hypothetical protein
MTLLWTLLALALPSAALAQVEQPAPPKPVQAFGLDHPKCRQWSDSCVLCRRLDNDAVACTTPGIACIAGEPACKSAEE